MIDGYAVIILSAYSTSETKILGVPEFCTVLSQIHFC